MVKHTIGTDIKQKKHKQIVIGKHMDSNQFKLVRAVFVVKKVAESFAATLVGRNGLERLVAARKSRRKRWILKRC